MFTMRTAIFFIIATDVVSGFMFPGHFGRAELTQFAKTPKKNSGEHEAREEIVRGVLKKYLLSRLVLRFFFISIYLTVICPVSIQIILGYVPKGFFPEDWAAFKAAEKREHNKKMKHFKSRPLVDFQKDLEAGKVRHLFPVMFAKQRVRRGEIRPSDIPVSDRPCSLLELTSCTIVIIT